MRSCWWAVSGANVEVRYDDSLQHRGVTRPFTIEQLQPIQIASADLDDYIYGRRHFTRDAWIDVLIRSIGYEPTHADFSFRRKLLYLLRLVPMVEHNYNLVELGPRGTGKSFVYREISPYVILVSGGQVTVPQLFVENSPPYKPMHDALQTAYDYLRANLRHLGSDGDMKDFDFHIQLQSLMQAKEGAGTGRRSSSPCSRPCSPGCSCPNSSSWAI